MRCKTHIIPQWNKITAANEIISTISVEIDSTRTRLLNQVKINPVNHFT